MLVKTRTAKQVREHAKGSVISNKEFLQANTGEWTRTEQSLFLQGLNEHGKDWEKIAMLVKTRTAKQVREQAVSEDQREEHKSLKKENITNEKANIDKRKVKKENMKQGPHVKAQRKNVTSSKKFHGNYRYFCSTENTGPKQQL